MVSKKVLSTGEIASGIGYTAQSVRNAVREMGLEPVSRQGRRLLYSVDQANVIAEHFGKEAMFIEEQAADAEEAAPMPEEAEKPKKQAKDADDSSKQIEFLKQQIATKDAEIAEKNKQIASLLDNLTATNAQLTTAQGQLADAQQSIKALSATTAIHTAADNRDRIILATQSEQPPQAAHEPTREESPRVDDLTRWQRFKSVFRRKRKG